MLTCNACRAENADEARFCTVCGASLVTTCAECGAGLPAGSRFCPACGAPTPARPASPAEMRKLVSILFADIVDSTAQGESLDPEDTRTLLAAYFEAMSDEIRRHGGTVEKFVGDAIMAVFGVPTAHEDDPVRAVRAARAMLLRLERLNAERPSQPPLRIRIGVNTGEVLAAAETGPDLLVTGDAVNVAARLEQAAETGTVVVGERTARALRDTFELRRLQPLELKGKSDAVSAWLVETEAAAADERRLGVPGLTAPMIGRDEELRLLQTTLEAVRREGAPHLVTILADAGVGKSRLLREFVEPIRNEITLVVGRCRAFGEGVALAPLAEILRREASILDTDHSDRALAKIAGLVRDAVPPELAPDPERTTAALASTIGLDPGAGLLAGATPPEVRGELVRGWRALLTGLGRRAPVVVVVEDIHWADRLMLELLDDLAEHVEGRVLFLCSARSDLLRSRPAWGGGRRNYSALPLDPLSAAESRLLISSLLDVDDLPAELKDRMLERAEGNPFFLEEILRSLIDDGRLVIEEGRWRAREGIADVDVPDDVQAVILARLDLLTPAEKAAVQRAAVIGRTFWRGALAELTGDPALERVLDTLQRRELVLERLTSTMVGEEEYAFKHVLIRDVAYESLPRHERAGAHAAAAAWIERRAGERVDELAELLAHHYQVAFSFLDEEEFRARGRRYALAAARHTLRRFAIQEAETFGSLAVDLSRPGAEQVEALEALGDLYSLTFRGDGAWKAYTDAMAELEQEPAACGEGVGRLAAKAANLVVRRRPTMRAAPTDEELGLVITKGLEAVGASDSRERAILLAAMGYQLARQGAGEATRTAQEAVELAERLGDPDVLSSAIDAANQPLQAEARYDEIYRSNARRVELVPRLTDLGEICDAHVVAAFSSALSGRYRRAIEHATHCIDSARGVDAAQYVHGLIWRIWSKFQAGEWEDALADQAEIERHEAEEAEEEPPPYALSAYSIAMLCHRLRGEDDVADGYLEMLRAQHARHAGDQGVNFSRGVTARMLAHRGETAEALDAIRIAPRSDYAVSLEALANALAMHGDPERTAESLPLIRETAARGKLLTLEHAARRLEAQLAASAGDRARAAGLLAASAAGFAELHAPWEEGFSRILLGELLLDDGAGSEAEAELARAHELFGRLGAVHDVARCERLLAGARTSAGRHGG